MNKHELSLSRRPRLSRRAFAAMLPGLALAPSVFAQAAGIRLLKLNCFEIRVSDPDASLRFYQGLFGMPVQARAGDRICLRVGDGPQFMAIRKAGEGEAPSIVHIGYSVADFDVRGTRSALERVGFEKIDAPPVSDAGIAHRMKTWTRSRGETEELYFADDRGLIVQLSGPAYCGGTGAAGDGCPRPEPAPAGLIRLADLNHFTVFVNDGAEANRFYQETFGLSVQAYQGPQSPVTGIGDGHQFVMYAGGRRDTPTPASINHASFNIHDFDVDRVRATLTDYGLSARGDTRTGPLMHYVSLRMPARGGAEGGTPELYFTDPDGILLQMQDLSYCGGGGYLGNECLAG
jgi:catechol 2,3-dioxygenase-like lactoylglutathione lyase family enzyme